MASKMNIKIKRVYEDPENTDGFRVLVDRLWPRGMKKESLHYDLWAKDITPSPELRKWFHEDQPNHWQQFEALYTKELESSKAVKDFITRIKKEKTVTLLYASKDTEHNHAMVLKEFLEEKM